MVCEKPLFRAGSSPKVSIALTIWLQVPDLISVAMNQQLPRNMTVSEGVGGLTKLAFQGMFAVASHI